jgi:hypothetical protein
MLSEGEDIPAFTTNGHETRVVHREYVGDIVAPASPAVFSNTVYSINAANSLLFPWLAPLAANYQQYRFNGMVFEFKTLSSDITAGGALGAVIMATNYDVNALAFTSKLTMENSEYAISAKPSRSQLHAVECDPSQTPNNLYYCLDAARNVAAISDPRFYNMGLFQIATAGLPSSPGQVLGELWVSYDVSLMKPDISATLSSGSCKIVSSGVGVDKTHIFGTTAATITGVAIATAVGGTITFLYPGSYVICLQTTGTACDNPTYSGSASQISGTVVTSAPRVSLTSFGGVFSVTTTVPNQNVFIDCTSSTTVTSSLTFVVATSSVAVVV